MSWRCSGADNLELIRNLCRHRIIKSKAVENAMKAVDRRHYAPKSPYEDAPQSLGFGATISAPHMHAYALEWIHEKLGDSDSVTTNRKVLDVGCGSGYLCACFYHLGYQVRGIDHVKVCRFSRGTSKRYSKGQEYAHIIERWIAVWRRARSIPF